MKGLLVEDNRINRRVITCFCSEFDVEVEEAEDGEKGILKYKNGDYDFVIIDFGLPGMDGNQAAKAMREINNKIPLVLWSANVNPNETLNKIEYLEVDKENFDHILYKPSRAEAIIKLLEQILIYKINKNPNSIIQYFEQTKSLKNSFIQHIKKCSKVDESEGNQIEGELIENKKDIDLIENKSEENLDAGDK